MSSRIGDRAGEEGSAVAEFVLVGLLLTVLTLSVLQTGFALHVRNTVLDAASEGARFGALADSGGVQGAERTRDLITAAIGAGYARNVRAEEGTAAGVPTLVVTVQTPLPLLGLVGIDGGLRVSGRAAIEDLDEAADGR